MNKLSLIRIILIKKNVNDVCDDCFKLPLIRDICMFDPALASNMCFNIKTGYFSARMDLMEAQSSSIGRGTPITGLGKYQAHLCYHCDLYDWLCGWLNGCESSGWLSIKSDALTFRSFKPPKGLVSRSVFCVRIWLPAWYQSTIPTRTVLQSSAFCSQAQKLAGCSRLVLGLNFCKEASTAHTDWLVLCLDWSFLSQDLGVSLSTDFDRVSSRRIRFSD